MLDVISALATELKYWNSEQGLMKVYVFCGRLNNEDPSNIMILSEI